MKSPVKFKRQASAPQATVPAAPFVLDFDVIFNDYIAANKRKFAHDRSTTCGASEVFNCIRQLALSKRHQEWGVEQDADEENWGAAHRGNLIEDYYVVPAITKHKPPEIDLLFAGADQITFVDDRNSVTPDGLFTKIPQGPVIIRAGGKELLIENLTAGCIGLEIKSVDPRTTLEEEKVKHFGQTQVALGLMREKNDDWKPEHWLILYVDASFLNKFTPFLITYQPGVYASAKMRAKQVWEFPNITDYVPEGKFDHQCDTCRWKTACGEAEFSRFYNETHEEPTQDPIVLDAVAPLVDEYRAAQKTVADAEENLERMKHALKEALIEHGARKVHDTKWHLTWYTQKGKTSLDTKAMIAHHQIDTKPFEKTGNPYDVLKITAKGSKK